ncbi:hypothetical protein KKC22_17540 [Myxococcota bacterium]|nr:hypothetical protein [Myxococcota bacterium]
MGEVYHVKWAFFAVVAAVGLTPYLAQTRKSHAEYLKARDSRDLLIENRPEVVAAVRAPLRNAIRSTLLLLAEPARAGHAAYILEPLARLRPRRAAVTPVAPAPTV